MTTLSASLLVLGLYWATTIVSGKALLTCDRPFVMNSVHSHKQDKPMEIFAWLVQMASSHLLLLLAVCKFVFITIGEIFAVLDLIYKPQTWPVIN